ncbi:MAG TPA: hypothetical protein VJM49_20020 [Acidimicrobiales bacterium]|nr:hypothetical protein [Acidimicrobiales bacterium]
MRSTRVLVEQITAGVVGGPDDGAEVTFDPDAITYADVFVVVREGEAGPGPNDWEVTLQTCGDHHLLPGEHVLVIDAADGTHLRGRALLRFSDGTRHLFRGDGRLSGFVADPG